MIQRRKQLMISVFIIGLFLSISANSFDCDIVGNGIYHKDNLIFYSASLLMPDNLSMCQRVNIQASWVELIALDGDPIAGNVDLKPVYMGDGIKSWWMITINLPEEKLRALNLWQSTLSVNIYVQTSEPEPLQFYQDVYLSN